MATDNRGVMVYLNPELESKIAQYCIDNDITRKNKEGVVLPALGTGILQYLKSQLLSERSCASPSTVLSSGLDRSDGLEPNAAASPSETAIDALTREDIVAIVKAQIDRELASLRAEVTGLQNILSACQSLELIPSLATVEQTSAIVPGDPTDWENSLTDLVATGMSSQEIATRLNLLGFTNTRGGKVSRQSIESCLNRRSDLKTIYDLARNNHSDSLTRHQ
jgi:DNA-binding NarL/FixJ family response regulator